jgi:hypothetical protein
MGACAGRKPRPPTVRQPHVSLDRWRWMGRDAEGCTVTPQLVRESGGPILEGNSCCNVIHDHLDREDEVHKR